MKLWLLRHPRPYDFSSGYDGAVVAAETEDEARTVNPDRNVIGDWWRTPFLFDEVWAKPEEVIVKHLGEALPGTKKGLILSDFHD